MELKANSKRAVMSLETSQPACCISKLRRVLPPVSQALAYNRR